MDRRNSGSLGGKETKTIVINYKCTAYLRLPWRTMYKMIGCQTDWIENNVATKEKKQEKKNRDENKTWKRSDNSWKKKNKHRYRRLPRNCPYKRQNCPTQRILGSFLKSFQWQLNLHLEKRKMKKRPLISLCMKSLRLDWPRSDNIARVVLTFFCPRPRETRPTMWLLGRGFRLWAKTATHLLAGALFLKIRPAYYTNLPRYLSINRRII